MAGRGCFRFVVNLRYEAVCLEWQCLGGTKLRGHYQNFHKHHLFRIYGGAFQHLVYGGQPGPDDHLFYTDKWLGRSNHYDQRNRVYQCLGSQFWRYNCLVYLCQLNPDYRCGRFGNLRKCERNYTGRTSITCRFYLSGSTYDYRFHPC